MAKQAPKHFFSNVPTVNAQRTLFDFSKTDTVTINTDYYYPNYKLLVCPGDTVVLGYSNFVRLLDPLQVPMMDNLYMETHYWFVPFDIIWDYTKEFFGEKKRPSDPDINTLPLVEFTGNNDLPKVGSVYDYFGIPIVGDDDGNGNSLLTGGFSVNALPLMAYYAIHDDWIMDEQRGSYLLDSSDFKATTFSPSKFSLYKRGKRFDYFTSTSLDPIFGSGQNNVTINLGTTAPVVGDGNALGLSDGYYEQTGNWKYQPMFQWYNSSASGDKHSINFGDNSSTTPIPLSSSGLSFSLVNSNNLPVGLTTNPKFSGVVADLSSASAITVEQLRRAFQVQAYYELCTKYGNRYTEYLYSQYGVLNPEQSMYRVEYLGATHQRLQVQPIVQNSANATNNPLGQLGGIMTGATSDSVFTRSFTKFGYIIGCINIYSDLTYFQGLEKDWQLRDRMDFPLSVFANLTDQPVYKSEIVLTGTSTDNEVFGYNEIYAWAKYAQNSLRGLVRPNAPQSVGYYSLAEHFSSVPVNDDTFITSNTPLSNITNVTDNANTHFIVNQKFDVKLTRELPMHSDPMKWMFRG